MSQLEISTKRIFYKERKWDFEKEYRTEKYWDKVVTIEERQIELPKEAFNFIILGSKISIHNKEEIVASTNKHIGNIPIIDKESVCQER